MSEGARQFQETADKLALFRDVPIPEGTRPLMVYRRNGDHVAVLLPGKQPIRLYPGDSLNVR